MKQSLLMALSLLIALSCSAPKIDQQAEAEKLMELSREWAKSVKERDVEKMLSYWAEDAVLMSPNEGAGKRSFESHGGAFYENQRF